MVAPDPGLFLIPELALILFTPAPPLDIADPAPELSSVV